MRELTVERRKAEVEGPRGLDTAGAGVGREAVSGAQRSEGEAGLAGSRELRCPGEVGVGVEGTEVQ